jgi:hypothetical protein
MIQFVIALQTWLRSVGARRHWEWADRRAFVRSLYTRFSSFNSRFPLFPLDHGPVCTMTFRFASHVHSLIVHNRAEDGLDSTVIEHNKTDSPMLINTVSLLDYARMHHYGWCYMQRTCIYRPTTRPKGMRNNMLLLPAKHILSTRQNSKVRNK